MYSRATSVSKSDSAVITTPHQAILVSLSSAAPGDAVAMRVITVGGDTVTLNLPSGVIVPLAVQKILSTSTTADTFVLLGK